MKPRYVRSLVPRVASATPNATLAFWAFVGSNGRIGKRAGQRLASSQVVGNSRVNAKRRERLALGVSCKPMGRPVSRPENQLPERNPLRNNTLFFSRRKSLDHPSLPFSRLCRHVFDRVSNHAKSIRNRGRLPITPQSTVDSRFRTPQTVWAVAKTRRVLPG